MREKRFKISIIGAGNMGQVLIKGMVRAFKQNKFDLISCPEDIIATRRNEEKLQEFQDELQEELKSKITTFPAFLGNREAVRLADIIILAVKPGDLDKVLNDLRDIAKDTAEDMKNIIENKGFKYYLLGKANK